MSAEHDTAFAFRGHRVLVRVTTPEVYGRVRALIPELVDASGEGAADACVTLSRHDRRWVVRTAHRDVREAARAGARDSERPFADLPSALAAVELEVSRLLLRAAPARQFGHLHAAGAVVRGRALVAVGGSGAGKSSIALAWSAAGFPVLGDDVLLLDGAGVVHPFPRLFGVDRARLDELDLAPAHATWLAEDGEAWYDPRRGGAGWAEAAPVGCVALVEYRKGAEVRIGELTKARAVSALATSLMPTGAGGDTCLDRILTVLNGASVHTVAFGSSRAAAQSVLALSGG